MFINTFHFSAVIISLTLLIVGLRELFRLHTAVSNASAIDEKWSSTQTPSTTRTYMSDLTEGVMVVCAFATIAGVIGIGLLFTVSPKRLVSLVAISCAAGIGFGLMRLWQLSLFRRVMSFYFPTLPAPDTRMAAVPMFILICYSAGTLVGLMR